MSDKLFEYFLAYNNVNKENTSMNKYNGNMLIDQIIMENIFLLEEENFKVNFIDTCTKEYNIYANLDYLRRIFDNIFSNIRKYSSKEEKIIIKLYKNNNIINIEFINECLKESRKIESNKIGLISSKKLMEQMKGTLEYEEKDNVFITKLKIPITE